MKTKSPLGKIQHRSVKAAGDADEARSPAAPLSLAKPSFTGGVPNEDKVHGKRRRGTGAIVSQTVRLRREDWQRMAEIRTKEGISSQQQFIIALGLFFAEYGLEPPVAP